MMANEIGCSVAAIRIKSKWHRAHPGQRLTKSMDEQASALAFIGWKLCLETAKALHREGFDYASDQERVGVICEFLAFIVHLCDRLAFQRWADPQRTALINALGHGLARHMHESLLDIAGPGDYRAPFIALLNRRLGTYAELSFPDQAPGFDLYRYLGRCVLEVMGESQTNRWVMDQVMAIEAPRLWEEIERSFQNLMSVDDPG